jgi:hypothetical protein
VLSRRSQATARKARYRSRLRDGAAALPLAVRDLNGLIELLLSLGWLSLAESENRTEITVRTGVGRPMCRNDDSPQDQHDPICTLPGFQARRIRRSTTSHG